MSEVTASSGCAQDLRALIESKQAVVGVIGLGYVGLPLALLFHENGFPVIGFDVDSGKSADLSSGRSYIRHIGADRVEMAFGKGQAQATDDFSRLKECDSILICVPTPLGEHREPDLSYVETTSRVIAENLRPTQLVILESTTYPGTTREIVKPILDQTGLECGKDYFLGFSPEREDPGNPKFDTRNIPKVVGGVDRESGRLAVALYGAAVDQVVPVPSAEVAEASKLLENIFRAVNIALVNELKIVFDRMGINVWDVIEAASTKPFGFMPFYPGPGLGGHCIPLDPFYLSWKAAEYGVWARFIELAGEVNTSMPNYVVEKTMKALNAQKKSVNGSKILILGLSYKPDIDDDRESPSFELISKLEDLGATVDYCDPYIPRSHAGRHHDIVRESVACTADQFASYDALVVSTPHSQFSDPKLYENVSLVVDTRNCVPIDDSDPRLERA